MRLHVALGLLLVFTLALPQGAIPRNNLGYGLKVQLAGGNGSGFLTNDSSRMYLVTARHVLFEDILARRLRAGTATISGYEAEQRFDLSLDLNALQRDGLVKADTIHDVAVVCLTKVKPGDSIIRFDPRYVKCSAKAAMTSTWWGSLRKYDQVQVGNDVYVFGYPTSVGLQQDTEIDYDRSLMQKGIVAGLYPKKKTIVLNIAANWGNSGGPVVEVEQTSSSDTLKFVPVGIVTKYIPMEEIQLNVTRGWPYSTITSSPYSVAEPLDPVIDIIRNWK